MNKAGGEMMDLGHCSVVEPNSQVHFMTILTLSHHIKT